MAYTANEKMKEVRNCIKGALKGTKEVFEQFKQELDRDPGKAMQWSAREFKLAATSNVYYHVGWAIGQEESGGKADDAEVFAGIKRYTLRKVLDMSTSPPWSTNQCGNILEQCELAVWAEFYMFLARLDGDKI